MAGSNDKHIGSSFDDFIEYTKMNFKDPLDTYGIDISDIVDELDVDDVNYDGPVKFLITGNLYWMKDSRAYNFPRWAELTSRTEEEIMLFKLRYV